MKAIEISSFKRELEKKLDIILGEDSGNPKGPKKESGQLIIYPLHNLKMIVLSLEWEITEDLVTQYLRQLKYLGEIFFKDKKITFLIKVQIILGNYIKKFKVDAHPFAFKMVQTTFEGLDKIIAGKNMTHSEKQKIISLEIKRYKKLKNLIEKNRGGTIKKGKIKKPSQAISTAAEKDRPRKSQTPQSHGREFLMYRWFFKRSISEMKLFIRNELRNLIRIELRKIKSQI